MEQIFQQNPKIMENSNQNIFAEFLFVLLLILSIVTTRRAGPVESMGTQEVAILSDIRTNQKQPTNTPQKTNQFRGELFFDK